MSARRIAGYGYWRRFIYINAVPVLLLALSPFWITMVVFFALAFAAITQDVVATQRRSLVGLSLLVVPPLLIVLALAIFAAPCQGFTP